MAYKIVIDASAALKWQFEDETEAEQAVNVLLDYKDDKVSFVVPELFYYELANAIHIAVQRERITEDDGKDIINDMLAIETTVVDSLELIRKAYINARRYKISVYDSMYFTFAADKGILLLTGDKRFFNAFKDRGKFIRWIGDYTYFSDFTKGQLSYE